MAGAFGAGGRFAASLALLAALGACTSGPNQPRSTPTLPAQAGSPSTVAAAPTRGVMSGPFSWRVGPVTAAQLGRSWRPGCPIAPSRLRAVTLSYWGFDHRAHQGTLVLNRRVVAPVVAAFRRIYLARFPIRRMVPIAAYGGDDNASMAADNTSGFNCRYAVATGSKQWSMHAYGEAVDIDPVENPCVFEQSDPSARRPALHRSRGGASGDGGCWIRTGSGAARCRVGVGRAAGRLAGLPALFRQRTMTAVPAV